MNTSKTELTTFQVLQYMIDNNFTHDCEFISRLILRMKTENKITLDELGLLVLKMSEIL
jgi:hypothetical protein